jgi:hypothetical protein
VVTEQVGFRKELFTENAACRLADGVFKSIDQRLLVGGIFWVLAKDFDCINMKFC